MSRSESLENIEEIFRYPLNSKMLFTKRKQLKRSLQERLTVNDGEPRGKLKVAILGGATTSDIKQVIELMLLCDGVVPV